MGTIRLHLLGGAGIRHDGDVVTGSAAQRHRLALLALLAAAGEAGASREKLVGLLWPEKDESAARNLLNQAVHALRRRLGTGTIRSEGDVLRLDPDLVASDLASFEAAVEEGRLAEAVDLHEGPFLDGFHLPGDRAFEDWVEGERRRLAAMQRDALRELAERAERDGDVAEAAAWWLRLAGEDRINADVVVRLMEALEAAGRRAEALVQAEVHATLLREELDAEPSPTVEALAARMRTAPRDPGPRDLPRAPAARGAGSGAPVADGAEPGSPAGGARRRVRRRRWFVPAAAAVGLGGVAAALLLLRPVAGDDAEIGAAAASATLAVLPFETPGGSAEDSVFSEGIHRDLITTLSKLGDLSVFSRASVMPYRDRPDPGRRAAEELGATVVLEGGVRRAGDRVRVDVRLTDAATRRVLWGEIYERALTVRDLFAIQTDITERIVTALDATLTPFERERLASPPTEDLTAYQYYHQAARAYDATRAGNLESARLLRLALEADSSFAIAWADLAVQYGWRPLFAGFAPVAWDSALAFAGRALDADPDLARGYTAIAVVNGHKGLLDEEAAAARRALQLDPKDALALRRLGESYHDRGAFVEALRLHREVLRLTPGHPTRRAWIGRLHLDLGDPETARGWLEEVLSLYPEYWGAMEELAYVNLAESRPDSALRVAGRMRAYHEDEPGVLASAAMIELYARDFAAAERDLGRLERLVPGAPVHARSLLLASSMRGFLRLAAGDTTGAEARFGETDRFVRGLIAEGATAPRWPYELGLVAAARGDADGALAQLEEAWEKGFRWAWFLERNPMADGLRDDPRFRDLVARMKRDVAGMRERIAPG